MTPAEGVFRVMLRMEIRADLEREFEETWCKIGGGITNDPANLGQWLSKSTEENGVYYIISDWVDEHRFRRFERSKDHLAHRAKLHPYRTAGSMTTMRVLYAMTGAAAR
jgi:heme-degrading monooxygenase HmoA